jgi:hypothetical protein
MNWLIGMFFRAATFAPNLAGWPSMIDMELATVFRSSLSRVWKVLMMMPALSFLQRALPIVQEYSSSFHSPVLSCQRVIKLQVIRE